MKAPLVRPEKINRYTCSYGHKHPGPSYKAKGVEGEWCWPHFMKVCDEYDKAQRAKGL